MPQPVEMHEKLYHVCIPNQLISGDFNQDGYDDLMVGFYYNLFTTDWSLVLNDKYSSFLDMHELPFGGDTILQKAAFHAYASDINGNGAYYPYILDLNGDGYDEMIVKEGAEDIYGQWHVWANEKGIAFKGVGKVNFGGEDNFLIEEDSETGSDSETPSSRDTASSE